ncbi:MAG TPA: hypothetical protein ENG40_00500 [Thermoprotei archaeon]|nr:hypothetical protein [Thermoprotei archaeon]
MVISFSDIRRLRNWAKENKLKIKVTFQGVPYTLVINKYIRAEDRTGRKIEWFQAFGTKSPHQVLSSFKIEKITIRGKTSKEIYNIEELLRMLK